MIHTRAKTFLRHAMSLALCASLGLSNVLAYDAHTENESLEIPAIDTIEAPMQDELELPEIIEEEMTFSESEVMEDDLFFPAFDDAGVLSTLTFGLLSATVETSVDTVNSLADMQAARDTVAPPRVYNATPRTVYKSSAFAADETVEADGELLGEYRLSFYCPCRTCNGNTHKITKSGTKLTQGRTIAVDSRIIPLGSKVYIDGYGVFIAEDTGSAIRGNRIDICVGTHKQAYSLGIDYANVYLLD